MNIKQSIDKNVQKIYRLNMYNNVNLLSRLYLGKRIFAFIIYK